MKTKLKLATQRLRHQLNCRNFLVINATLSEKSSVCWFCSSSYLLNRKKLFTLNLWLTLFSVVRPKKLNFPHKLKCHSLNVIMNAACWHLLTLCLPLQRELIKLSGWLRWRGESFHRRTSSNLSPCWGDSGGVCAVLFHSCCTNRTFHSAKCCRSTAAELDRWSWWMFHFL